MIKIIALVTAMAIAAVRPEAAFAAADQPATVPEKMGLRVTTPTGMGVLAGFSAVGPSDEIQAIEKRLITAGCPTPLVRPFASESRIFAPFSDHCDKAQALALLSEVQNMKFANLHGVDVQFFPLPAQTN